MKFFTVDFVLSPYTQERSDVMAALAADVGFESFEDGEATLRGYVQQSLFDKLALDNAIATFPFSDTTITYTISETADEDWNAQWEQEGFAPIVIEQGLLTIHDGRHLPEESLADAQHTIEIDARLAFGTGTHDTTRLMCQMLATMSLDGCKMLDAGCGTGILGIAALKLGADRVTAYDIDEWSTDNTRHNAVINAVDQRLTVLHGDSTLLEDIEEPFDVVAANINRNILLSDMPRFCRVLRPGGFLLLSGFYCADVQLIEQRAAELGLHLAEQHTSNDWAALKLRRQQ